MRDIEQPRWYPLDKLNFVQRACPICKTGDGLLLHKKTVAGCEMHFWLCAACNALYTKNPLAEHSLQSIFNSKEFFAAGTAGGDNIDYFDFIGGEKFLA